MSASQPGNDEKRTELIHEREHLSHRLTRVGAMIASGDLSPLAYAMWLRWHRLEFRHANSILADGVASHQHSGGPRLAKVLRALHIPKNSIAIDFGVGMGIAALTLSPFFSLVIGVDLSPEFIAIARRNMTKLRIRNIELHCTDARNFTDGLDRVTYIYMFNPFPLAVVSSVMENLRQSLKRSPRHLTIIYKLPACHETVVAAGFRHTRTFNFKHSHPFSIYEA